MKNPFEQLEALQPGAAHCFEETVSIILRATVKDARRVKVFRRDGGVDSFTGIWGQDGELDVYQIKCLHTPWGNSQKKQIRDAFKTATDSKEFNLRQWVLVVPSDLTKEDWQWFDEWRVKQTKGKEHKIDIWEGSRLSDILLQPECGDARQKLREWGVQGLPSSATCHRSKCFVVFDLTS